MPSTCHCVTSAFNDHTQRSRRDTHFEGFLGVAAGFNLCRTRPTDDLFHGSPVCGNHWYSFTWPTKIMSTEFSSSGWSCHRRASTRCPAVHLPRSSSENLTLVPASFTKGIRRSWTRRRINLSEHPRWLAAARMSRSGRPPYSRLACLRLTETSRERGVLSTGHLYGHGKPTGHVKTNRSDVGHQIPPMFARVPTVAPTGNFSLASSRRT